MAYKHIRNFWPLVPAVDIQAIVEAVKANEDKVFQDFDVPFGEFQNKPLRISDFETDHGTMNVLVVGDGLGCLIKTMTRMYRHGTLNLNIYLVSNFPECLTRNLLLLSLFYDAKMGISERVELFLEIFGNTFIRASTATVVETKSGKILDDIVSFRPTMLSAPAVSLSLLKQKEIDDICRVLMFLKGRGSFEIGKAWEESLRAYFGTRYDSRYNLFDYHFNMKLSHYPIINLKKYTDWRENGVAFRLRNGRYDNPNKTLCANSLEARTKSPAAYVGDIATSPYIAYGVECKNEIMFQKVNNRYVNTSVDISKFNLIDFMSEFSSSNKHCVDKKLKVYLLSYSTFCKSKKFEEHFDAIYVTCDMTNYAEDHSLGKILTTDGTVVFETVNNVVNSTNEQKKQHLKDIDRYATMNKLKLDTTLKSTADNLKIYVRKQ